MSFPPFICSCLVKYVSIYFSHPKDFHVPFLKLLFVRKDGVRSEDVRPAAEVPDDIEVVYANDCVSWHRRGEARRSDDVMNCPRMTADGKGIGPKKQKKAPIVPKKAKSAEKEKTPKTAKIPKEKLPKVVKDKRPPSVRASKKGRLNAEVTGENSNASDEQPRPLQVSDQASGALQASDQPEALQESVLHTEQSNDYTQDNRYLSEGGSPYFKDVDTDTDVDDGEQLAVERSKITTTRKLKHKSIYDSSSESSGNNSSGDESDSNGGWGAGCDNEGDSSGCENADEGSDGRFLYIINVDFVCCNDLF